MKAKLIRLLQIVVAMAGLSGLGWTSYQFVQYLHNAPRFEVKALAISGFNGPLKRVTENQIAGRAEFDVGTNVFRVDLNAIRERVERLEWVRYAIVQRVLPDQIIVKVVEREPIGLARINGEVYQFDTDAAILNVDGASTTFPILDGLRSRDVNSNTKKVAIYRQVLEEIGQNDLSEVHVNDSGEVSVVSANDPMIVTLGTSEYRLRWIKFQQLKSQIQQQYPQAVKVDLRFKNQVIVRMKDDEKTSEQVVWGGEKKTL
jgi:cell division septal protein FtsQ